MNDHESRKLITPGRWYTVFDESGNCIEAVYDKTYREILGFESEEEYTNTQKSWTSSIHPDDKERLDAHLADCIAKHPEGKDFDIEYRMMTKKGYRWFHDYGHCVRREDGSIIRCDGVVFDIQRSKDSEVRRAHENLKREVLDFIVNNDEDPIELLSQFAEKIRVVLDCDQVIYRDLEKTRIMVNSPAIEKTWSVPFEYCLQCQHLNPHHPMYAGGYTEMSNCQEGWQGIPVYHKCPIKSSLTRLVYCNGEIAGYLAIHYVQKYHDFTDIERETLEAFCNNLSLIISRYEAKRTSDKLEGIHRMMKMIFSLSDEYDPIMVLDPETGEYDWYRSMSDDVTENTSMSAHGDNIYQNIGIDGASIIHEEDRAQFQAFYTKDNMMRIAETGEPKEIENRWFIHTEGRYKWKYNKAVRMVDESGKAYVVIGVIDTTERKAEKTEQEKAETERLELLENQSRILALEDDFVSLYDIDLETGQYNIYAKGQTKAYDINDRMSNSNIFFEDTLKNVVSVVYPDDRETLIEVLSKEGIRKRLENESHFDCFYRLVTEGRPFWAKMRVTYKDETKRRVIIGAFNAEDEMAQKQAEERRRNELLMNNQRIMALEDNLESVYDVELDSGHYAGYVKGEFYQSNIADKLLIPGDFFEDLRQNIDAVIYPDDREELHHILQRESIRKALEETERIEHYYRTFVDGKPMWFKLRIVYKDEDKKSVIIGAFNAQEEVSQREELELQRQHLIESMAGNDGVFIIDIANDKRTVIHDRLHGATEYGFDGEYTKMKEKYIDLNIAESDRAMMHEMMSLSYMSDRLKRENDYSLKFTDLSLGSPKYFEMKFVRLSDTEVLQSVKDCDNETRAKLLSNKLLSDYESIYVVNFGDLSWKPYKRSSEFEKHYPVEEDYVTSLGNFIKNEVHPDDRETMSELIDMEQLRKKLEERDSFSILFRKRNQSGDDRHYRCEVFRSSDRIHFALTFQDITEEVEIQEKHKSEGEKTRKLIANATTNYNAVFVVNMKDDTFETLRMDDDIVGKELVFANYTDSMAFFINNVCHPADRKKTAAALDYDNIRRELADKDSFDVEYRAVKDDSTTWWVLTVTKIDDDDIAIGFAHKDIELTKYHLEEQRYDENFALFVVDIDRKMIKVVKNTEWFKDASEGHSYPYSELILDLTSHFTGEQKEFFTKVADINVSVKELAEGKKTYIYQSPKLGNKWVDVTSYVTHRHEDGTPAEFTIGFAIADSMRADRQELSRQLAEQKVKLEEAYKMAQTASEAKSSFLFNMSHDIRTPMNAITGFTMMAKKYAANKEFVLDYLDKIDVSGQQLLMLINQVLEMARIESGKIEFNEQPVNVKDRFDAMVTVLKEQCDVRGLKFISSLQDISHFNVMADDARMGQITLNITGNAIKYTPEGGTIDFSLKEVPARREGYGTFVFTVRDTGIGMSEEFMNSLFEPFAREKTSTVSKIQGTGLGLSIVKSLIDLAGGKIEVQSEKGKGSRFEITMDFRINEEADEAVEVPDEEGVYNFKGRRALLVEDNELNREIARYILEDNGIKVEDAEDGDIAVQRIQKIVEKGDFGYYDFILMDIQMPRMNGYEATERIRAILEPMGFHVPIIAVSANAFEEDKAKCKSAGMDDHVSKPVDLNELLSTIVRYL